MAVLRPEVDLPATLHNANDDSMNDPKRHAIGDKESRDKAGMTYLRVSIAKTRKLRSREDDEVVSTSVVIFPWSFGRKNRPKQHDLRMLSAKLTSVKQRHICQHGQRCRL